MSDRDQAILDAVIAQAKVTAAGSCIEELLDTFPPDTVCEYIKGHLGAFPPDIVCEVLLKYIRSLEKAISDEVPTEPK